MLLHIGSFHGWPSGSNTLPDTVLDKDLLPLLIAGCLQYLQLSSKAASLKRLRVEGEDCCPLSAEDHHIGNLAGCG